jgi:hypothetical protein
VCGKGGEEYSRMEDRQEHQHTSTAHTTHIDIGGVCAGTGDMAYDGDERRGKEELGME